MPKKDSWTMSSAATGSRARNARDCKPHRDTAGKGLESLPKLARPCAAPTLRSVEQDYGANALFHLP